MVLPQQSLELAKQGDPGAIAHLINQALQSKGIIARVTRTGTRLRVMLEAEQIPDQQALVPYLQKNLTKLELAAIEAIELYGKQACASAPAWRHSFSQQFQPQETRSQPATPTPNQVSLPPPTPPPPSIPPRLLKFPVGNLSQRMYQMIFSGVMALILILVGANLRSCQTLLTKPQTPQPVALIPPKDGVYQAQIVSRKRGVPVIMVMFNDKHTYPMIVDTGASGTLITPAMAATLNVVPEGQITAQTANSQITLDVGYLESIEVDGAKINRVPVAIGLPDMEMGLLGHDFFGSFDVTVRENIVEFHPRN